MEWMLDWGHCTQQPNGANRGRRVWVQKIALRAGTLNAGRLCADEKLLQGRQGAKSSFHAPSCPLPVYLDP